MYKKLIAATIVVLLHQTIMAQTPDEVNRVFPGQQVVYLNYNEQLNLSIKDDAPAAQSDYDIELMLLGEKNASSYSRYAVYHSGYSELNNLDAYTKVPNGSGYKKVKITNQQTSFSRSNSVFYDDVKQTTFDFSSLTQNAIEHIDYSLFRKDAHLLGTFSYPGNVPLMNGSYTVVVPNDIAIKYVVENDPKGLFQFSVEKRRKETIYKWALKNIQPIDDNFGDAPSGLYFEPTVIVYVASYQGSAGTQSFLSSTDDLYKWDAGFLKELNVTQDAGLVKIVDSIIADKKTEIEKAKSIYRWVQQNLRYVAFENGLEGFRPRQAADICNKRYGDCKDMSSIITQMLRIAGIKAYYTWIGTRELPYDYTDLPLPLVNNHMISTANIDGKWIFLDGTDPTATFGVPPSGIQNKEALISINDKEYKILRVPIIPAEKNVMTDTTYISFTDNGIKGHENVTYYGYDGEDVYGTLMYSNEEETKDYVKKRMGKASNKFILGNYTITRVNPEENIANIAADFEIPGYGKKIGDEYYINLNLEKIFEKQVIDTVKRKVPLEIEYNSVINECHILQIPKGYTVNYLPKDFSFDNNLASIKISYKVADGNVIATQEGKMKKIMINPEDFDEWNKDMAGVQLQYKEAVVLKKNN